MYAKPSINANAASPDRTRRRNCFVARQLVSPKTTLLHLQSQFLGLLIFLKLARTSLKYNWGIEVMADYSKQTVAQLRQLLKDRGIPSTGLTRKAQIVEKLEEADGTEGGVTEARDEADGAEDDAPAATEEDQESESHTETDAPPNPAEQAHEEGGGDAAQQNEDAPGPALSEAGGTIATHCGAGVRAGLT